MTGKGSKQRPTNADAFGTNFDNIFRKKTMSGWQPIETAPKRDDVQILTFHADFAPKHGRNKLQKESCYWYQTSFWSEKFGLFVGWPLNIQPTHWMLLPPPPGQGRAQPDHSEQHLEMVAAARAVVERWDTPLWKDAPATAVYINRLRDALPPAIGETME